MWLLAATFVLSTARPETDNLLVLAEVLRDRSAAEAARQQAANSLGCAGGDEAVRHLQAALRDAAPTTRASIAQALGNTRSRLAVPVLIDMFRNDPARDEVCDALVTLTHRTWCDGGDDDATLRRAWRRWWSQMKGGVEIFAPEGGCNSRVISVRDDGNHETRGRRNR